MKVLAAAEEDHSEGGGSGVCGYFSLEKMASFAQIAERWSRAFGTL